jgi:L-alanine-DL-glutamate epimerase-like enolase superfamily enzyme
LSLDARIEQWPLASTFRIARGTKSEARVVVVALRSAEETGFGECLPYPRYGESPEATLQILKGLTSQVLEDVVRHQGSTGCASADNALDCAAWDLRAQLERQPVWRLLGLEAPQPVTTAFTITIADPEQMRTAAAAVCDRALLKIKLGGDDAKRDADRLLAVRAGAPDSQLIVDANEGWSVEMLESLLPTAAEVGVAMIEQPLPADDDEALASLNSPVSIGADESVHGLDDLASLRQKYQVVNVKLDKAGGLSRARGLIEAARSLDFQIMIGCMVATSMSMAPAMLLAGGARFVDLDGPLLLSADRAGGLDYHDSQVAWPSQSCWGDPRNKQQEI